MTRINRFKVGQVYKDSYNTCRKVIKVYENYVRTDRFPKDNSNNNVSWVAQGVPESWRLICTTTKLTLRR